MLVHFVADEFLELELDLAHERLRLARDLGLSRIDLTNCKVFVSFTAEGLDNAGRTGYLVAKGRHTSSGDAGQLGLAIGEPEEGETRCDEVASAGGAAPAVG